MNEKGVFTMIGCCLFLFWLFGAPSNPEPVPEIPTDGLIEAMQPLSKTLRKPDVHETDFGNIDHISDAGKKPPNSSENPNSSPSPSDRHEKVRREIIIFTRPNCPPCDRWKRCEQAKFEADGWTVAYCDQHNYPLTPTFLIDAANKQTEHRGYLPFEKLKEVLK